MIPLMGVEEDFSHNAPGANCKPTKIVSHIHHLHPITEPIHMITLFDSCLCVCVCVSQPEALSLTISVMEAVEVEHRLRHSVCVCSSVCVFVCEVAAGLLISSGLRLTHKLSDLVLVSPISESADQTLFYV